MKSHQLLMSFIVASLLWTSIAQANYPVTCEDPNDCPGWVAGLSHASGVCSAFLVSNQIIATNLHCLPPDLRREKVSCQGRVFIQFPKTSRFAEQKAECDEIVHVSPPISDRTLTPDFAFFRLKESTSREVLGISQEGIQDGSLITLYKVDPGPTGGKVVKAQCPAIQNSLFNPYYSETKSPLVSLIPCPIIRGNSGSALVGSDGKAHGIVFSIYDIRIPMDPSLSLRPENYGAAANGSNFSCLNTGFLGYNIGDPPACLIQIDEASQSKFFTQLLKTRSEKLINEIADKSKALLLHAHKLTQERVEWKLETEEVPEADRRRGLGAIVKMRARCWVGPFSQVKVPVSRFRAYFEMDKEFRPLFRIDEEKSEVTLLPANLPSC